MGVVAEEYWMCEESLNWGGCSNERSTDLEVNEVRQKK